MRRFLLRVVPIAMIAGPAIYWDRDSREANYWLDRRAHTYEARSLAERIAHGVCPGVDLDRLPVDIDAFAVKTADNPRQVAVVRDLRAAARMGDADAVRRLADAAVREENRLLPIRTEAALHRQFSSRVWGVVSLVFGFSVALFQACLEWATRRARPTFDEVRASLQLKDDALHGLDLERIGAVNLAHDLMIKIAMMEEWLEGERFNSKWREAVGEMRAAIEASARKVEGDDAGPPV